MTTQTRTQRYAAMIFTKVQAVPTGQRKNYAAMAQKLPVLIRSAGLAQALAFVESRGEDEDRLLLDHLADAIGMNTREQLLTQSRTASLTNYMRLTQQAMSALLWFKRFAQSVGTDKPGGQK